MVLKMRTLQVCGWVLFSVGVVKIFWLEYQLNVLHAVNRFDVGLMALMFFLAILLIGIDDQVKK